MSEPAPEGNVRDVVDGGSGEPRVAFDLDLYEELVRSTPCFICAIVAGDATVPAEVIWRDNRYIAFLAEFPNGEHRGVVLRGHVLLAPVDHREDVIGDFDLDDFIELQTLLFRLGHAVTTATPTERLYVFSFGSKDGNAHVHWHLAPLPPGTPYHSQQFAALMPETAGLLELDQAQLRKLARDISEALQPQL